MTHSPADPPAIDRTVELPITRPIAVRARLVTFSGLPDGAAHFALGFGDAAVPRPLVRLHSECVTGDVFGSARCDCGAQLDEAVRRIAAAGGWLLYLRQEGRGIGLPAKVRAYALQDEGLDTYQANAALGLAEDARDYRIAVDMLQLLGIGRLTLLSNNPLKAAALAAGGLDVAVARTATHRNAHNARYLSAKRARGHALDG